MCCLRVACRHLSSFHLFIFSSFNRVLFSRYSIIAGRGQTKLVYLIFQSLATVSIRICKQKDKLNNQKLLRPPTLCAPLPSSIQSQSPLPPKYSPCSSSAIDADTIVKVTQNSCFYSILYVCLLYLLTPSASSSHYLSPRSNALLSLQFVNVLHVNRFPITTVPPLSI